MMKNNNKKLTNVDNLQLKGAKKLKNEYKKSLKLSEEQRSILVGTLLGDAHLETRDTQLTARYCLDKKRGQEAYVRYVFSVFSD